MIDTALPRDCPGAAPWPGRLAGPVVVAAEDPRTTTLLREAAHGTCPHARVHVAGSAEQLHVLLAVLRPALTVADLALLDIAPRELVALARGLNPLGRVVVVAGHGDDERLLPALRSGAAGFLLKHDPVGEVAAQLRAALSGAVPLTAALARQLRREAERGGQAPGLPRADLEILEWVAAGDDLAQVAARLALSGDEILRRADQLRARARLGDAAPDAP